MFIVTLEHNIFSWRQIMGFPNCGKMRKDMCIKSFSIEDVSIPAKVVINSLENMGRVTTGEKADICKMDYERFCMSHTTFQSLTAKTTELLLAAAMEAMTARLPAVKKEPAAQMDKWPQVVQKMVDNPSMENIEKVLDQIDTFIPKLTGHWSDPNRLNPDLVIPTLQSQVRAEEAVSYLRLMAIAIGKVTDPSFSSSQAAAFLSNVLEFNQLSLQPVNNQPGSFLAYQLIKFTEGKLTEFKYKTRDSEVKVASIQFESGFADTEEKVSQNIERLARLVEQAAKGGAKFIVTPEATVQGYSDVSFVKPRDAGSNPNYQSYFFSNGVRHMWCHDSQLRGCSSGEKTLSTTEKGTPVKFVDVAPIALEYQSEKLAPFARLAKKHGVYVSIGYIEKEGTGKTQRIYNAVNVYGPDGEIAYHYRKTNLWKAVDQYLFTQAQLSSKPYFDTPYGRISAAICFDGNFIFPQLARFGVDTLLYSVAWVSGGPTQPSPNHQMIGGKVRINPTNVVMANWVWPDNPKTRQTRLGSNAEIWGSGLSYIMDRRGSLRGMVTDNNGSGILYSTIPASPPTTQNLVTP